MRYESRSRSIQVHGFSLLELLVAMTVSLLLLAGVMTLFANSRSGYENNDRLARIQENGRFALEMIARDVRAAGFWGCAKRVASKPLKNILVNSTDLLWNFGIPVQGFDATTTDWSPSLVAPVSTDTPIVGSDVLVVRGPQPNRIPQRVQVSMTGGAANLQVYKLPAAYSSLAAGDIAIAASCDQASVFKVSTYTAGGSGLPDVIARAAVPGTAGENSTTDLGNRFYADLAEVYPVQTVVYFVGAGTGGNSLFRRVGNASPQEVVEGVDSFQVKFGVDADSDHRVDSYELASGVTDWTQVIAVRIGVIVRSLDEYGSDLDTQDRTLLDSTFAAQSDRRMRQVFTTTAMMRNRAF
jgi:type IV pilus assembly protein PilW